MKESQRVTITKRMLKEGLLRLLQDRELKSIRVNELCEESGVNRATFYRHYTVPQDVLLELEQDIARQIFPHAAQPASISEVQAHMEQVCAYLHAHADVMKILFRCHTKGDMEHRMNEFYRKVLELRKSEPRFAHLDDDTVKILVSLLGGGCYCLLRQWIMEDIPKTPQEIAAILCNVFRWPAPPDLGAFSQ